MRLTVVACAIGTLLLAAHVARAAEPELAFGKLRYAICAVGDKDTILRNRINLAHLHCPGSGWAYNGFPERPTFDRSMASRKSACEKLRAEGVMAEQDVDAALAANRIAEAQLEALQTRLSFTRIQAPVSGVVTARHVEVGDLASPRAPLLELAAGDGLLLRVPVSELEVVRLAEGDLADITVDALPELRLQGRIARIYPAADSASRQVTVELKIAEAPPTVRLGFLARAHLVLETMPAALLVPEDAVLRGAEAASFVWLVRDGVAAMRPVEVGLRIDGRAVISRGLAPGDQVVVSGMAKVREGAPVAVVGAAGEPG